MWPWTNHSCRIMHSSPVMARPWSRNNNKNNFCVWNKFIFHNDTTSYRLRNSEMRLALPQPRTNYVRKSFSYSGAVLWNSLPTDIRVSKTLGESKTKLSNFSFEWIYDTAFLKSSAFCFHLFLFECVVSLVSLE